MNNSVHTTIRVHPKYGTRDMTRLFNPFPIESFISLKGSELVSFGKCTVIEGVHINVNRTLTSDMIEINKKKRIDVGRSYFTGVKSRHGESLHFSYKYNGRQFLQAQLSSAHHSDHNKLHTPSLMIPRGILALCYRTSTCF